VGLGTLYSERKAYAEALGEFQQAALIQNDDPELHLRMGELYRETSDLANAERELRLSQSQARGNPALLDRIQQTLQGLQAPRSTP